MLKNRTISVDLVKKDKANTSETTQPGIGFEKKANIIGGIIGNNVKRIGIAVCAYVVLDTVRKVAVASVTE